MENVTPQELRDKLPNGKIFHKLLICQKINILIIEEMKEFNKTG